MWGLRDHPALSQVGRLLDPAAEGHAAALEPRIELRNGVGAIVGMEQCVCQGVGMIDVHRPAHHGGDRMGRRQLLEYVAELSQIRVRGGDPEQAAILLHHVDAGSPVEGVHHQVHRSLRTQDIAKRTQTDVRIGQMVKHSGADHLVERASELADVLNRELVKLEILQSILLLELARVTQARVADIDGGDSGIRLAKGVPSRPATCRNRRRGSPGCPRSGSVGHIRW